MVLVAGGLLGAVVLAVVGVWALQSGAPRTVPVIAADTRPVRERPENPGGMQVAGVDDHILSGRPDDARPERLSPPPETPVAPPVRTAPRAARATPAAEAPPVQPAALTSPTAPMPLPIPPQVPPPPGAAVARAPASPSSSARPPAAGGKAEVQFGALSSMEAARAEWNRLSRRAPELFRGRQPAITKLERNGTTLYRLRSGGFADGGAARAFCDQARARGVTCIPAT